MLVFKRDTCSSLTLTTHSGTGNMDSTSQDTPLFTLSRLEQDNLDLGDMPDSNVGDMPELETVTDEEDIPALVFLSDEERELAAMWHDLQDEQTLQGEQASNCVFCNIETKLLAHVVLPIPPNQSPRCGNCGLRHGIQHPSLQICSQCGWPALDHHHNSCTECTCQLHASRRSITAGITGNLWHPDYSDTPGEFNRT